MLAACCYVVGSREIVRCSVGTCQFAQQVGIQTKWQGYCNKFLCRFLLGLLMRGSSLQEAVSKRTKANAWCVVSVQPSRCMQHVPTKIKKDVCLPLTICSIKAAAAIPFKKPSVKEIAELWRFWEGKSLVVAHLSCFFLLSTAFKIG